MHAECDGSQVRLDWEKSGNSNVKGYKILRRTSSGTETQIAEVSDVNTNMYVDPNVKRGFTYFYSVEEVNGQHPFKSAEKEVNVLPETSKAANGNAVDTRDWQALIDRLTASAVIIIGLIMVFIMLMYPPIDNQGVTMTGFVKDLLPLFTGMISAALAFLFTVEVYNKKLVSDE